MGLAGACSLSYDAFPGKGNTSLLSIELSMPFRFPLREGPLTPFPKERGSLYCLAFIFLPVLDSAVRLGAFVNGSSSKAFWDSEFSWRTALWAL